MKNLTVVLLVALAGFPALAQKTILDGNNLDDSCRYTRQLDNGVKISDTEFGKATFCEGYIRGVLDEIWMQTNRPDEIGVKNVGRSTICADAISNEQAIKVAIKYLQDHPAKLHLTANYLIRLSLQEAFPCKSP
jgi:Rap1a immunity proteins